MNYRALGRTGLRVSEISVGTWALGAGWGEARDEESLAALRRAVELGVDFSAGLAAVEELKELVPPGLTLAQLALRWILMFDEVSCAIPGARRPAQAEDNIRAGAAPPLSGEQMRRVEAIYQRHIKDPVHYRW
jgi:aryl-alcohol dehydrogenase-like predicted oxidoreductase